MTQRQDYILRNKQIVLAKAQDGYGSVLFHKPAQITKTTALSTQKYLAQRHFIKLTAIFTRVGSKISVELVREFASIPGSWCVTICSCSCLCFLFLRARACRDNFFVGNGFFFSFINQGHDDSVPVY